MLNLMLGFGWVMNDAMRDMIRKATGWRLIPSSRATSIEVM